MRIARVARSDTERDDYVYGIVEGPPGAEAEDLELAVISNHPVLPFRRTEERLPLADVRLLAPVLPTKVVCVGKNYAEHAREVGGEVPAEPLLFLKPSTAVAASGDPIVCPPISQRVDYEGELAVVMGGVARAVSREQVPSLLLGLTCANDVTARDLQAADGQWTRAKGFDTFCPLGPWIETELDPSDLALRTTLDGEVRQRARTSQLVHDVAALVSAVSAVMTLLPGDVILTGTPSGIGPMRGGQTVAVTIDGIGTLSNPVVVP